jgi:hypothetical protein
VASALSANSAVKFDFGFLRVPPWPLWLRFWFLVVAPLLCGPLWLAFGLRESVVRRYTAAIRRKTEVKLECDG